MDVIAKILPASTRWYDRNEAVVPMVLGDALLGASLAVAGCLWWLAFSDESSRDALLRIVRALLGASVAFVALSLLPRGILLLGACLVAPVAMGLGLAAQLTGLREGADSLPCGDTDDRHPGEAENSTRAGRSAPEPTPLPRVLLLSIVISVFVADLLLSLFPVSLFSEASPLFAALTDDPTSAALVNLTEPALIAALLIALFSGIALLLEERERLKLPLVCSVGFFAVAVGFVTFPYHFPGGAPIGVAEAGRVVILVFIIMALLLGPMPHVYEVVRQGARRPEVAGNNAENTGEGAESAAPTSLQREELAEAHLDAFASTHRLSPREREILGLISKGRDVPYIEQELVLSKSTVKTHIRHIYEKCEVSSRQALIDLLQSHPED